MPGSGRVIEAGSLALILPSDFREGRNNGARLFTSLAPDEIVTAVEVPLPPAGTGAVYEKFVTRSSEDRPCVGVFAAGLWFFNRLSPSFEDFL